MKISNKAIETIQNRSSQVKGEVQRLNKSLSLIFQNSETLKNELKQEMEARLIAEERNTILEENLNKKEKEINNYKNELEQLQIKIVDTNRNSG